MISKHQRGINYRINWILNRFWDCHIAYSRIDRHQSNMPSLEFRRLVSFIKRDMRALIDPFMGELNDDITRKVAGRTVRDYITEQVADISGAPVLSKSIVICDETNNTSNIIDNGQLAIAVQLKGHRCHDYLVMKFLLTRY